MDRDVHPDTIANGDTARDGHAVSDIVEPHFCHTGANRSSDGSGDDGTSPTYNDTTRLTYVHAPANSRSDVHTVIDPDADGHSSAHSLSYVYT